MRLAISWMIHRSCRASPGGLITCARQLHAAVGVGEGAGLLREGRGRQDDVGVERGLGEEQVLHDQMIELGQRLRARGCRSGSDIAGFSPSTYMPLISPAWIAFMISTTVRPALGIELLAPELLERARADRRVSTGW